MATTDHPRKPLTAASIQTSPLREELDPPGGRHGDLEPGPAFLELRGLTKRYGPGSAAVDNLDLSLPKGRLLGLLGPSGCGKSTTLRMIAGLVPVTEGQILVGGEDVARRAPHKRDIGVVFQDYALFPHLTVAQNIAFGLETRRIPRTQVRRQVDEALEMVRLSGYGDRKPREMSGGQQQRVALARALVIQPRLLLLDEPLSNLDAKLRDEMRIEIREIQQQLGITTVFVTHDQVEALAMCDRIGVMTGGRLAQLDTPENIYERPSSAFVANFVGRANLIDCEIVGEGRVRIGEAAYSCDTGGRRAGAARAMIRPHRIALKRDGEGGFRAGPTNTARGRVTRTSYVGDVVQYELEIDGATLKVETPTRHGDNKPAQGETLRCEWEAQDMRVFHDASS